MLRHTEHVDINRPASEVYEFLADATNDVRWRSEVTESTLLAGEPGQAGAQYRQVMKPGRREMVGTHEIVAVDPPRRIVWRTPPGEGPLDFSGTYSVEPTEGGCRVTLSTEVRPRGLFKLGQPFMRGFLRKVSERYARDLKATLESANP